MKNARSDEFYLLFCHYTKGYGKSNTLYTDNIQIKCFIKFIGYCSLII